MVQKLVKLVLGFVWIFVLITNLTEKHISGTIPATLSDFKIEPPWLLTPPVKNEIPVKIDLTWSPQ